MTWPMSRTAARDVPGGARQRADPTLDKGHVTTQCVKDEGGAAITQPVELN
jgi:hypothetical protein